MNHKCVVFDVWRWPHLPHAALSSWLYVILHPKERVCIVLEKKPYIHIHLSILVWFIILLLLLQKDLSLSRPRVWHMAQFERQVMLAAGYLCSHVVVCESLCAVFFKKLR